MTSAKRQMGGDLPAPRELLIDLTPSDRWGGAWWRASWQGLDLAHSRDPLHAAGRLLVGVRQATPADVVVCYVAGVEVARESVSSVMKRRARRDALSSFWKKPEALAAAVAALDPPPDPGHDLDQLSGLELPYRALDLPPFDIPEIDLRQMGRDILGKHKKARSNGK